MLTACGSETEKDTTAPTITINGERSVTVYEGDLYIDGGATANDDTDESLIVSTTGSVDTSTPGEYTITYTATDSANNSSTSTRTVLVIIPDLTPPVITLNGLSTLRLLLNDTYIEEGATATDDQDPPISITTSGAVDSSTVGEYIITYSAIDYSGNSSTATRTISVEIAKPFITTWNTDIESDDEEENRTITIYTKGGGYNYQVNWGDSLNDENVNGSISHTYESSGTYTISINGDFPQIYYNLENDNKKLKSIEQWGEIKWESMHKAFYKTSSLHVNANDAPDLSLVTDMSYMFSEIDILNSKQSSWNWDVSNVESMKSSFKFATTFNQDISSWNISSVTDISEMFRGATMFDQDISGWDTSNVNDMYAIFSHSFEFNQNINSWNISSVNNLSKVFFAAKNFNQPLNNWDTSNINNMSQLFFGAYKFNHEINSWNTSLVTDMTEMFLYAFRFNQPLNNWDVSSTTIMEGMFYRATDFNQNLSNWNVSSVENMKSMYKCFSAICAFNQDISNWDISSIKFNGMEDMFSDTKLSTGNYDQLLLGWSQLNLENDVNFNAGSSTYSASSQDARNTLINTYGWTISDGGITP